MRALVLGAAVSGLGASKLLTRLGIGHAVYDRDPAALETPAWSGAEAFSGEWKTSALAGVDLVVASPGFSPRSAPLRSAEEAGVPVWSELELAVRHIRRPVAAVTGTNGKTTVVELTAEMLQEAGIDAAAAGNIGRAASEAALEEREALVLEASSFQLTYCYSLAPRAAVLLNVTVDHLDWHGSAEEYRKAKAGIFRRLAPGGLLVYGADDPGAAALADGASVRKAPVYGSGPLPDGGFGAGSDRLELPGGSIPLQDVPATDPAYRSDLAAAGAAAMEMGADFESVARVMRRFRHRPHRRQVVGQGRGVTWINDSKATNPHAALAAVRCYPSVVLIAGGRNKGLDLSPLASLPNVRRLIAVGESGPELLRLAAGRPSAPAGSLEQAVALAGEHAKEGDVVLLSPGCASFDMFGSYQERGAEFTRLVREHLDRSRTGGGGAAEAEAAA